MTTQAPQIGPGNLAKPAEAGGPAFAMSSAQWINIQVYVNNALALPTNNTQFATLLGSGAPTDLSPFAPLIACYAGMNSSCNTWQNTTFPNSVDLASDVYEYSKKVSVYYGAIPQLAAALQANPNDATSAAELKALLQQLSAAAADKQSKANAVFQQIQAFSNATSASQTTLCGANGTGGLIGTYEQEYGNTSADVQTLTKELTSASNELAYWNAQYSHDVTIAATTPTYGWFFPVGTIAASITAGIYGAKAVHAMDQVHSYQQQIQTLDAELQADANLIAALKCAELSMNTIATSLNAALPIIQLIEGEWGAIASDLGNLVNVIETDIAQAIPILMGLGVQEAINDWTAVGNEANAYRVNAYVQVSK